MATTDASSSYLGLPLDPLPSTCTTRAYFITCVGLQGDYSYRRGKRTFLFISASFSLISVILTSETAGVGRHHLWKIFSSDSPSSSNTWRATGRENRHVHSSCSHCCMYTRIGTHMCILLRRVLALLFFTHLVICSGINGAPWGRHLLDSLG
jgi:hypothetical protein